MSQYAQARSYGQRQRARHGHAGAVAGAKAKANTAAPGYTTTPAAAPTVPGPPVDPNLVAQQNAANTSIALGNAWDTYSQGQIGAAYGNVDNPAADLASNPYSQAALKLQAYNQQKRGTSTGYAATGHLYSGSLQTAKEADLSNYNQGMDALRKQKQGALDSVTKGKLDRYSQVGATLDQDTLASLLKALGG